VTVLMNGSFNATRFDVGAAPQVISADLEVFRCWKRDTGALDVPGVFAADPVDVELLTERQRLRDMIEGPVVGDWVVFADGVIRRIGSYWELDQPVVQTANGGSWHLNQYGTASFGGGLCSGVPVSTLTDTTTTRPALFWFFHRAFQAAHNAVYCTAAVRVWSCSEVSAT